MTSRTAVALTSLLLLGAGLSACASESDVPTSKPFDTERMYRVAADPGASATEIIDAGRPVRVAGTGTGAVVVAYLVESDDDEGPQASAWRLYDAEGERVADGKGSRVFEASAIPDLHPLPDGVLLDRDANDDVYERIAPDGTLSEVPSDREPAPTRAGDLLLETPYDGPRSYYRPSDHTRHRMPPLPRDLGRDLQGSAIDSTGAVWLLEPWDEDRVTIRRSADGSAPWSTTTVPLPNGGYPSDLVPVGDRVYLPMVGEMDGADLVALHVRDVDAPPTAPWEEVDLTGLETSQVYGPTIEDVGDGRVLIGDSSPDWAIGGSGDWERLDLPGRDDWSVTVVDRRLFALGHRSHQGETYVSDDLGETWARLRK